jgi:GxxExxY protein
MELIYKEEAFKIIGACMEVHRELGPGFHESIYQEALEIEFKDLDISYMKEKELIIYYKSIQLNKRYIADFICFDKIVLELKALSGIVDEHISQVINYLKATELELGLIVNFGEPSLKYKRIVL